jgi:sterol 3beta-glucosyltransferase
VKSGYLAKRGRQNPKYNRYWFRLKGDVLSYYTDPSDHYFPKGNIDLRYGISAHIADKEKGKDATYFTVVTHQRKFHFRADSTPSAKEWVKSLQKIIFRSHNDGDSVKISLPIENVMDIEESPVIDFAETCKIRVIDNDETFAIDEVSPLAPHHQLVLTIPVLLFFFSIWERGSQCVKDPGGRQYRAAYSRGNVESTPRPRRKL